MFSKYRDKKRCICQWKMKFYKIGKYGSWRRGASMSLGTKEWVVWVRALKSEVNELIDREEIM